jgi:tripartite-type tricarboxylate transporter receptor subunit TctC
MSTKQVSHLAGFIIVYVALACISWPIHRAAAQPYPSRPIKLIGPHVAGSPADIVARTVGDKLSISLKQPVVVENKPGAGGNIGTDIIAKAAADGYTLGHVLSTVLTVNPSLYKKLPFDPDKDFRPISIVTTTGQMLVVHPSIPVYSVAEFVAYAKAAAARNEPIAYATGGNGAPGHLAMEYFRLRAGFDAIHVPYRGNAPMVVDLVAGQVKAGFVATSGMMDHVRAGRLRGLGVSHDRRAQLALEVPTIAESGYPGFKIETFQVLLAPAGLPNQVAATLEREVQAALKHSDVIERLRQMDTTPVGIIGPAILERIKTDRQTWAKVVAATDMRVD